MLLKELMEDVKIDPSYKGEVMADDYVFAINTTRNKDTDPSEYAVVQEHVEGVDAALNSETNEKQYIRGGKSSSKKSTQRTFTVSGDKFVGDEAQDYFEEVKYKDGQEAVTDYVYFNIKNGKGEKGAATVSVDKDGGGNAGDNAGISVKISKNGAKPKDYTWTAPTAEAPAKAEPSAETPAQTEPTAET